MKNFSDQLAEVLLTEGYRSFCGDGTGEPWLVGQFRKIAEGVVATVLRRPMSGRMPQIAFDFEDSLEFNATAYQCKDEALVTVNIGVVTILPTLFNVLLARSTVLPEIGYAHGEVDQTILRGNLRLADNPSLIAAATVLPRDIVRARYAMSAALTAFTYLVAHEVAHVFNGHLLYDAVGAEGASMNERGTVSSGVTRQTLEMDADSLACTLVMQALHAKANAPALNGFAAVDLPPQFGSRDAVMRLQCFTIQVLWKVMGWGETDLARPFDLDHPPSELRTIWHTVQMLDHVEQQYGRAASEEMLGAVQANVRHADEALAVITETPVAEPSAHILSSPLGREYLRVLLRRWATIRPALEAVAYSAALPLPTEPPEEDSAA